MAHCDCVVLSFESRFPESAIPDPCRCTAGRFWRRSSAALVLSTHIRNGQRVEALAASGSGSEGVVGAVTVDHLPPPVTLVAAAGALGAILGAYRARCWSRGRRAVGLGGLGRGWAASGSVGGGGWVLGVVEAGGLGFPHLFGQFCRCRRCIGAVLVG
jgi:hypothetical protein